jgi:hypothetical protein
MSYVIYYSNYCENSKKTIKSLNSQQDIHWLCIDKRVKEKDGTYIVLENGQKVLLPPAVTRIPAMLSLRDYSITYGNDIIGIFSTRMETQVKVATKNNMEPVAFSFSSGNSSVVSDSFSSWDLDSSELSAQGNGGIHQMHNYVDVNYIDQISGQVSKDSYEKKSKMDESVTIDRLRQQREQELRSLNQNGPPIGSR